MASDMDMDTVNISESDAFETIITQASVCSRTKAPEYAKCLQQFVNDNHLIKNDDDVVKFFKTAWTRFKRLKSKKLSHADILGKASKKTNTFDKAKVVEPPVKTLRKLFTELGARMKKERTDGLLQNIEDFVQRECPELTTTQLLGYLVHRINLHSHKDVAEVGHRLFTGSSDKDEPLDTSRQVPVAVVDM